MVASEENYSLATTFLLCHRASLVNEPNLVPVDQPDEYVLVAPGLATPQREDTSAAGLIAP